MSTGGPPAGLHSGGNARPISPAPHPQQNLHTPLTPSHPPQKADRGLVDKLKDAIQPGSGSAKRDGTQLPGDAAHESQDRGGGGVLNALKPGGDNREGSRGGGSTLDAAREATQSMKGGAANNMPSGASGFKAGIGGGPGTQGATASNSTA